MVEIPYTHRDLLTDEAEVLASLATIMPDGSPQVTPVWFDFIDGRIRVNTAKGRVKEQNMSSRPRVAFLVIDPKNPYRYLQVRGRVVDRIEDGALEHIHKLADKYTGEREFRGYQREGRVMFVIEANSVSVRG
ncbi:MAG: PPOX class F420-dependent oxidoreductase [Anaerolineales bacterium]|nr:PPOX class F420-dependent oxidoreductase [Anaerolineales bacterium]